MALFLRLNNLRFQILIFAFKYEVMCYVEKQIFLIERRRLWIFVGSGAGESIEATIRVAEVFGSDVGNNILSLAQMDIGKYVLGDVFIDQK